VTVPNSVKSIKIDRGVEQIMAGSDGAAFVYYVAPRAKLNTVLVEGDMLDTSSVVCAARPPLSTARRLTRTHCRPPRQLCATQTVRAYARAAQA
jgi:hypothetical protein